MTTSVCLWEAGEQGQELLKSLVSWDNQAVTLTASPGYRWRGLTDKRELSGCFQELEKESWREGSVVLQTTPVVVKSMDFKHSWV